MKYLPNVRTVSHLAACRSSYAPQVRSQRLSSVLGHSDRRTTLGPPLDVVGAQDLRVDRAQILVALCALR